uniref:DUF4371 domain-containing protein n=1 Tax=Trichuris muris TaxID=70415 RepID=A0A5S6QBY1_TRIMR
MAKCGKLHAIGEELILPAVSEVLRTVVRMPATEIIKKISLSNNTVPRRIDDMSADVENTLCNVLRTEKFCLQVDESTLPQNDALLLAYVRFIKEGRLVQELLFARELLTDTRGESIFRTVENFFKEKEIPLTNVIAVATDGAPSILGRHREFLSYLKEKVPDLLAVHCVIHRQHLVAKRPSDRLNRPLQYMITAEMNLQLQGDQLNLIKTKTVVTAFIGKLAIFGQNLGRGEYRQFPDLNDLKENGGLPDDVVQRYWVLDPFTSLDGVEVEELIEMQANEELKPKIRGGYTSFLLQQEIIQLYPRLWNVAMKFLIPFPSSYLIERRFSAVTDLLGKKKPPTDSEARRPEITPDDYRAERG